MDTQSSTNQSVLTDFRRVCADFDELANSTNLERIPFYGGIALRFRYFFGHPRKAYTEIFKLSFNGLSNLNAIELEIPVEEMLQRLEDYPLENLKALDNICDINLRIHKERLSNNYLFKLTVPIASIYAITKGANELFSDSSMLSNISDFMSSRFVTEMLDAVLLGLITGLLIMLLQYLFQFIPNVRKSQTLKDIVKIAYENKERNANTAN